jgi:hypothetical protein
VCLNSKHGSNYLSGIFLRYTSAAQDLVMHSRGKLYEKNWKSAEGKAATIDDISVFVIPLAPYKEEYREWKQEYEAIHGIYETSCESSEGFGKLSLKTSPIATGKAVISGLATENSVNRDLLHGSLGDSSASNIPSYNADTALKIDDKTCPLAPGQDSSVLVIENTSSVDNLSSHYNCDAEIKDTPPSSEKSASNKEEEEECASVNALTPCTDTHTTSELDVFCQPTDLSQKPRTSTQN